MEINANLNANGVNGTPPPRRPSPPAQAASDRASFTGSSALEQALKGLPDARPEAVERARQLVNDPHYPPAVMIHKISVLIAARLKSDSE
jgi:hypothetical protein